MALLYVIAFTIMFALLPKLGGVASSPIQGLGAVMVLGFRRRLAKSCLAAS